MFLRKSLFFLVTAVSIWSCTGPQGYDENRYSPEKSSGVPESSRPPSEPALSFGDTVSAGHLNDTFGQEPPDLEVPAPSVKLIMPIEGVRPEDLLDTFNDARSEGREHNAIDIIAPKGTPVLAASEGQVVELFHSEKGGNTIYVLAPDNRTVYYYAHLDSYARNLIEGQVVSQGQLIGYVGDTGNAVPGNYHLHFSIWTTNDPSQYWDGTNINPYPLLGGKPGQ